MAPEDFLSYRIVPDSETESVEVERKALKYLRQVISWRGSDDGEDEEFRSLPARLREGLRHSTAFQLVSTWVELRCIEILVAEVAEHFSGIAPSSRCSVRKQMPPGEKLLSLQEWFRVIKVEVEFREPLDGELQETRDWLASIPPTA